MKTITHTILTMGMLLLGICFAYAQNVTIPDANFKAALLANAAINTVDDGEISVAEAQAFTGLMNVSNKSISDMTGIEEFTNLTILRCYQNSISSLDISANTALTSLAGI